MGMVSMVPDGLLLIDGHTLNRPTTVFVEKWTVVRTASCFLRLFRKQAVCDGEFMPCPGITRIDSLPAIRRGVWRSAMCAVRGSTRDAGGPSPPASLFLGKVSLEILKVPGLGLFDQKIPEGMQSGGVFQFG